MLFHSTLPSLSITIIPFRRGRDGPGWLGTALRADAGLLCWQEVRAVEILLNDVAQEFDGEDPLRPLMRGILNGARKKLSDLHELLSAIKPFELEEPDDDSMSLARTYFDKGKDLMARL